MIELMKSDMINDVRNALDNISEIERQLISLRGCLTSVLINVCDSENQENTSCQSQQIVEDVTPVQPEEQALQEVALQPAQVEPAIIDLEGWLNERDIKIKQKREEIVFDSTFDRLAKVLGENYDSLRPFYEAIKRRVGGSPYPRTISLRNLAPAQVSIATQFGNDLRRNGFLKEFRYERERRIVFFEPQEDGRVTNFFTGNWLERYVLLRVRDHLVSDSNATEIKMLINPKVLLPNGQDFELDILIGTSSMVLWFECKTGSDYPVYVAKYRDVAKKYMRISPAHCALVLLEPLSVEEKRNNSDLSGMSVVNLPDLDPFLERAVSGQDDSILISNTSAPSVPPIAAHVVTRADEFTAALNRVKLRPLNPTERRRIINDLRESALGCTAPTPLQELADSLKETYDSSGITISKSQILDVCRALRISGICQRGCHPNYEHDVWFMRTEISTDGMFDACARLYLWTLFKEPSLQASHPLNVPRVAAILFENGIGEDQAKLHIAGFIEQLVEAGNCVYEEVNGVLLPRAVGEEYQVLPL